MTSPARSLVPAGTPRPPWPDALTPDAPGQGGPAPTARDVDSTALGSARWDRVRWLFAAIWLVYLAQPAGKLWSDPDLVHRYLGWPT